MEKIFSACCVKREETHLKH